MKRKLSPKNPAEWPCSAANSLQVVLKDVEEGDEDGQLGEERDAGGKGVDLVLLVEAHHLLLHALFVVFVFGLDLFDLRLQDLQRTHPFELFVGQRDQQRAGRDSESDDRAAPGEADGVVEEDEDFVGDVDEELRGELDGDRGHQERISPWWTAGSTGPTRSVKRFGTGSKPPWLKGLQRSRRQQASSRPRTTPKRSIDSVA
jgi:hypothetical protein